ncbi:ABC transporter ATP-binding protein [Streptomyces sp. NBC_00080]|uniref:ABC transporter ATP-binding protein n=2 Tax=Streptomyces TaxID=1883 RepID=UPI003867F316
MRTWILRRRLPQRCPTAVDPGTDPGCPQVVRKTRGKGLLWRTLFSLTLPAAELAACPDEGVTGRGSRRSRWAAHGGRRMVRSASKTGVLGPRPVAAFGVRAHLSLAELSRGSRALLFLATALAWCSTGAGLILPWVIMGTTAALTRREAVGGPVLWLSALALAAAGCQAGSGWLLARAGEEVVLRLRRRIIDHVMRLPLASLQAQGAGDITARITSDCSLVRAWAEAALVHLPVAALGTAATLTTMAWLDPTLTLLTLGAFAAAGVPLVGVIVRTRRAATAQQAALADLGQRLFATLAAFTPIKAYRHEAMAAERLGHTAARVSTTSTTAARLQSLMGPLVALGQQVAVVAVTVVASQQITAGELPSATFSAFFFLLLYLTSPITVAVLGIGQLRAGRAARARLTFLLGLMTEPAGPPQSSVRPAIATCQEAVSFQRVSFTYAGATPTLLNQSFIVPRTGLTALIGPSGAGKSTVFALISRFIEADEGCIRILGQDISAWRLPDLRRHIAYVDQNASVLEGTIRENLQMGRDRPIREQDLWETLETVGLREAVRQLPQTLDTHLGRGRDLSGGQRQRLVLARALLSDAVVFLLDEPTSQLDDAGEQRVMGALNHLAKTRAVVMATHRLSSVRHAHHTVVITPPALDGRNLSAPLPVGMECAEAGEERLQDRTSPAGVTAMRQTILEAGGAVRRRGRALCRPGQEAGSPPHVRPSPPPT